MLIWDFKKILLALALVFSLQGCVAFVGGAAIGATGAVAIYDRRNVERILKDGDISTTVLNDLQMNQEIKRQCHVEVTVYRATVLLAGQAPTEELKQKISSIAKGVPEIKQLYNQVTIQGPTSSLTRASDTWITTKVKAAMLAATDLNSGQFKVLTENGTVFLLGMVSRYQAKLAVETARKVNGVQKVVKVFSYTREISDSPKLNSSKEEQTDNYEPHSTEMR